MQRYQPLLLDATGPPHCSLSIGESPLSASNFLLRRMHGLRENGAELVGLVGDGVKALGGNQVGLANDAEPCFGFTQLFQTDAQLVGKIATALRGTAFLIIRCRRRATAQDLIGNVLSQRGLRQRVRDISNPHRKVDEAIFQFLRGHLIIFHWAIFSFCY